MDDAQKAALFKRLEEHLNTVTPDWTVRVVHRSSEVRARMIDRSDTILVQLIVAEVLRAELQRRLIHSLPFDDVDSDDTEHVVEGFGQAFAFLNMKLREEGKL